MKSALIKTEKFYNPLDMAELVIMDRDWAFDRPDDKELVAEVKGTWSTYRVWFSWQEEVGGLTLTCVLDNKISKNVKPKIYALLALVNEKIWLGHFSMCSEDSSIMFRHSLLLSDGAEITASHLHELLDIAINECERFYPAFQCVVWGGKTPAEAMEIALFETIAEA